MRIADTCDIDRGLILANDDEEGEEDMCIYEVFVIEKVKI